MNMTVVKTANTIKQVEELGLFLKNSDLLSLNNLYDPFYGMLEGVGNGKEAFAITLNKIDLAEGQYFHIIGMTLENGITYSVDDRHTLSSLFGDLDIDPEQEELKLKARRWDAFTGMARSAHSSRVIMKRKDGYPTLDSADIDALTCFLDIHNGDYKDGPVNT